jgi:hypothetical protein
MNIDAPIISFNNGCYAATAVMPSGLLLKSIVEAPSFKAATAKITNNFRQAINKSDHKQLGINFCFTPIKEDSPPPCGPGHGTRLADRHKRKRKSVSTKNGIPAFDAGRGKKSGFGETV